MATLDFTSFQQALEAQRTKSGAIDRLLQEAARLEIDTNAQPQYQCLMCCDRGVVGYEVPADDPRFGKLYPCTNPTCPTATARLRERQAKLLEASKIPARYAGYTFETWEYAARDRSIDDNMILDTARAWVESSGHLLTMSGEHLGGGDDVTRAGLIFIGDYGTGKTGLMIAMAHALLERGEQPLYIRAMDYIDVKYRTYGNYRDDSDDREQDLKAVELVQRAPILMLDDFNVQNGTANKQDVMEELIRYRHNNLLPMVITCNHTIPQLENLWGKRSVTVLLESCHVIPVTGKPLRDTRQLGGVK